jgi:anti-sigma regulatory factor (Ser/Thr protein kinase)
MASLAAVREAADREGRRNGLTASAIDDLVLAANELATNVVRHGGGAGRMWLWRANGRVFCQVIDDGPGMPDADHCGEEPPGPSAVAGRGLWMIRRFTDAMDIETGPTGTTVTVAVAI